MGCGGIFDIVDWEEPGGATAADAEANEAKARIDAVSTWETFGAAAAAGAGVGLVDVAAPSAPFFPFPFAFPFFKICSLT